jgi:hypothetical protein
VILVVSAFVGATVTLKYAYDYGKEDPGGSTVKRFSKVRRLSRKFTKFYREHLKNSITSQETQLRTSLTIPKNDIKKTLHLVSSSYESRYYPPRFRIFRLCHYVSANLTYLRAVYIRVFCVRFSVRTNFRITFNTFYSITR